VSGRPDPDVGVFDTLLAQDGEAVALAPHLARLATSVRELYDVGLDVTALAREVSSTVAATGSPLQRVRVAFVPGTGLAVDARPLAARPRQPWHLVVRRLPDGWGRHKWRDRSQLEALTGPADPAVDPLLVDEDDLLLETGRGSVFVVQDREVSTPPLDGRILPGVTREAVLRILEGLGIDAQVRPVALRELTQATEVFVSSSIGGVRSVATCDVAGPWPAGPVTRAVDEALEREWAT
jgi:para-aminobenzoate synthetase/4-amino-4-deoxychorismate lyase